MKDLRTVLWHLSANYTLHNQKQHEEVSEILDRLVSIRDDVVDSWQYEELHISHLRDITNQLEKSVDCRMLGEWYEVEFTTKDGNVHMEDFDEKDVAMEFYLYHSKNSTRWNSDYKLFKVIDGFRIEF